MTIVHNPPSLGAAPAAYSHGIEFNSTGRVLFTAGQVGIDGSGRIGSGIAEQTEMAFANIKAVLAASGMDLANVIKTTIFMTNPDDYAEYSKARSAILGNVKPASTLVFISQLVKPEFLVEIEAVAVAE